MAYSVNAMSLTGSSGLITVTGSDLDNRAGTSAVIVIDITTLTGTGPTATFAVQGKDPLSGKYYTILTTTALAAVATTVLRVSPYGLAAAANLTALDFLPVNWRVTCVQGGTAVTNLTCTVGAQLMSG